MAKFGDWLVFIAAIILLLLWVWRRFDKWLHEPPSARLRKLAKSDSVDPEDEVVQFLQDQGYEVLSGKHRVALGVIVDEGPAQATRLYFDYLVCQEESYYLVKAEKARQPMDWTPSGLRERLLAYSLLFPECEGIIIVDSKDKQLHTVRFRVEADKE